MGKTRVRRFRGKYKKEDIALTGGKFRMGVGKGRAKGYKKKKR